jgi:hypothetical protein
MTLAIRNQTKRLDQQMVAHIRIVRVSKECCEDGIAIASMSFLSIRLGGAGVIMDVP